SSQRTHKATKLADGNYSNLRLATGNGEEPRRIILSMSDAKSSNLFFCDRSSPCKPFTENNSA
ncbi:MAG: hypothetical protein JW999_00980, partial [Methanotrichaceae archaeon]|nr:hypothetical protein [Methanotrichaceae archaeon]